MTTIKRHCISAVIVCLASVSCSDYFGSFSQGTAMNPETADDLIHKASIEWGASEDEIVSHMSGFSQVETGESGNILQFKTPDNNASISYRFNENGELCATVVILPTGSGNIDLHSLLSGFSYVGELNEGIVYENPMENTMAAVWQPLAENDAYDAIGFAPVISDDYELIAPVAVSTSEDVVSGMVTATLSGNVSGVDSDVEAGFIYGRNPVLSETEDKKASISANGDFSITVNGLLDDEVYYYCAYAIVDNIVYKGETMSFQTEQLTYTINGKPFKMVKVEGGPTATFSMMQTELPHNADFRIGPVNIGKFGEFDRGVPRYEIKRLIDKLREQTGLPFRFPTRDEWKFAASGGNESMNYTYSGSNDIDEVAWYGGNSGNTVHDVAGKRPNELGLYDMSGNYAEICQDEGDILYYIDGPCYGGNWSSAASDCKVTSWKSGSVSGEIPGTDFVEKNAYDTKYIAIRLVYSRE